MFDIFNVSLQTILIFSFFVLTLVGFGIFLWLKSRKKSSVGTTPPLPTTQPIQQPIQQPTQSRTSSVGTTQHSTTSAKPPVIDAAVLVGVLPDAIKVTIESDDPNLRNFSDTYYYSFSVKVDPKFRTWSWTLDSVKAPGGNGDRGEIRAQLDYSNEEGKWNLSLNTGDPYPEPPVLLRATTGPLDKWDSVWGAKWTRKPLGTIDSKRAFVMPIIKVSPIGTGVIAPWT
jgi:hypothetical protein